VPLGDRLGSVVERRRLPTSGRRFLDESLHAFDDLLGIVFGFDFEWDKV